ncbi:2OG-Fe(II) oxygenase family protein [Aurantiacibacter sediminis]|uniref:2OG-Fe(II) oxygenase family protein n=1 Tax=Aurantiacibacter sediminis TaxID=2793064 RepID=A0ABS0N3D1_9SPHN|nr:2OG-Fe(II) oxygenase family protein [Aurantiacibacter sediminis]MBH5322476.1 2OG-Fe(II) oxygenase family protein [Aurantiacibacter sediminis]
MTDTRQLFATPFIIDRLQSEAGIAMLRDAVDAEMMRDRQGVSISNIGGWHSNTNMLEWGGEAAKALVFKAMTMADEASVDIKSPDASRFGWHPELWANVSQKGDANQYHTHPGSYWSAVAYVDDGYESDADPQLGGELQLLDPRSPMVQMAAPDLRMKGADGAPQSHEISIRPQTGMIVMFPSWLQHAVRPFKGEGTRISIAINLSAGMKKPH